MDEMEEDLITETERFESCLLVGLSEPFLHTKSESAMPLKRVRRTSMHRCLASLLPPPLPLPWMLFFVRLCVVFVRFPLASWRLPHAGDARGRADFGANFSAATKKVGVCAFFIHQRLPQVPVSFGSFLSFAPIARTCAL